MEAKWIWLDKQRYPEAQQSSYTFFCERKPYAAARFRKDIFLAADPVRVPVRISADCRYVLFVNGAAVSRGPAAVGGDYGNTRRLGWRYTDRPALRLRKGFNRIEALVFLQPAVESDVSDGHGGFFFDAEILLADGTSLRLVSDESWLAAIDLRFVSARVTDLTLAAEDFAPAAVTENIWSLEEKPLPELASETVLPVNGKRFRVRPGERVRIDFGKVYAGYLHLSGTAEARGKAKLTVDFEEVEDYPVSFRNAGRETVYFADGAFSFSHRILRSARYAVLETEDGSLDLAAEWEFSAYPVERRGYFRCSDPLLDEIYGVCVRTAHLCMNTCHMDSPVHQEAIGCTGDYLIQSLINYYSFGDFALTRLDLVRDSRYFALTGGHRLHTSYGMLWVQWLRDYLLYSGDRSVFGEVRNGFFALMDRYEGYLDDTGIVSYSDNFWFVDWTIPEEIGELGKARVLWQSSLTAFTYEGFRVAAELCETFAEEERAARYRRTAGRVRDGFQRFFDSDRGLYFGGFEEDGKPGRRYFGVHPNILAALYGLAGGREREIMEKVMTDETLPQAQPYFLHFELLALEKCGLFEKYGLGVIRKWKGLLDECPSSLKERWERVNDCDYSHAWSGTPGYILPAVVLGVRPAAPGYEKVKVNPKLCGLRFAEGEIPVPGGTYFVRADESGTKVEFRKA